MPARASTPPCSRHPRRALPEQKDLLV
jgi:hypothetical protein